MDSFEVLGGAHAQGESKIVAVEAGRWRVDEPLMVETEGGRYQVQWDDSAPATPFVMVQRQLEIVRVAANEWVLF